jgi:hypothetical protein
MLPADSAPRIQDFLGGTSTTLIGDHHALMDFMRSDYSSMATIQDDFSCDQATKERLPAQEKLQMRATQRTLQRRWLIYGQTSQ